MKRRRISRNLFRSVWIGLPLLFALLVLLLAGLARGGLFQLQRGPDPDSLPPEKREIEERIDRETKAAPLVPKKHRRPPPDPYDPPPLGIFKDVEFPGPSSIPFRFLNRWIGRVDEQYVQAWAGSLVEHPSQGLVFVVVAGDYGFEDPEMYPTPSAEGGVRIVDASGSRLVLASESGARFVFDVRARQYE